MAVSPMATPATVGWVSLADFGEVGGDLGTDTGLGGGKVLGRSAAGSLRRQHRCVSGEAGGSVGAEHHHCWGSVRLTGWQGGVCSSLRRRGQQCTSTQVCGRSPCSRRQSASSAPCALP